jgi:nicotinate phosphoribosyltransferase
MAWGEEIEAFRKFGEVFPDNAILLIDTYDTLQGARHAVASGAPMQAVRLDSGDLLELSKQVRQILNEAGRQDVKIVASGDLNEYKIRRLLQAAAPIDSFGVGTELVTSRDEPALALVYKLVEQESPQGPLGRFKLAKGKTSYPYVKQVYRHAAADGTFAGDLITRATEQRADAPLLEPVLEKGRIYKPLPALEECRRRCQGQRHRLPTELLQLEQAPAYPVHISEELQTEARHLAEH